MQKRLVVLFLLISTFSFAAQSSVLTLESCDVSYYGADLNAISSVPKQIVEEILSSKGYTFDKSADGNKNGLVISLRKDFGERNNQDPAGEEPSAGEIIGGIIVGTVSLVMPVIYTEESVIRSNETIVFSNKRTRATYFYNYDSLLNRTIKSLEALPDCVLN